MSEDNHIHHKNVVVRKTAKNKWESWLRSSWVFVDAWFYQAAETSVDQLSRLSAMRAAGRDEMQTERQRRGRRSAESTREKR